MANWLTGTAKALGEGTGATKEVKEALGTS
jgi:hypothetical protein